MNQADSASLFKQLTRFDKFRHLLNLQRDFISDVQHYTATHDYTAPLKFELLGWIIVLSGLLGL